MLLGTTAQKSADAPAVAARALREGRSRGDRMRGKVAKENENEAFRGSVWSTYICRYKYALCRIFHRQRSKGKSKSECGETAHVIISSMNWPR